MLFDSPLNRYVLVGLEIRISNLHQDPERQKRPTGEKVKNLMFGSVGCSFLEGWRTLL
jgi:hypothetical protein